MKIFLIFYFAFCIATYTVILFKVYKKELELYKELGIDFLFSFKADVLVNLLLLLVFLIPLYSLVMFLLLVFKPESIDEIVSETMDKTYGKRGV